jgi:hypothetical protein
MHFFANLVAGLDRHQNQLEIVPSVKNPTEIVVLLSELLNIGDETLHLNNPFKLISSHRRLGRRRELCLRLTRRSNGVHMRD